MKKTLVKIRHSPREIDRSSPLTKRKYPPPRQRICTNSDRTKSRFFQDCTYRISIKKIDMKRNPALRSIFSPDFHLQTSSIGNTDFQFPIFFEKTMTLSEKTLWIIYMFKNVKRLYFLKIVFSQRTSFNSRNRKVICR